MMYTSTKHLVLLKPDGEHYIPAGGWYPSIRPWGLFQASALMRFLESLISSILKIAYMDSQHRPFYGFSTPSRLKRRFWTVVKQEVSQSAIFGAILAFIYFSIELLAYPNPLAGAHEITKILSEYKTGLIEDRYLFEFACYLLQEIREIVLTLRLI